MFLTFFRNILFFQQMFPRLRGEEAMFPQLCFRNNVSSFAGAFRNVSLYLRTMQSLLQAVVRVQRSSKTEKKNYQRLPIFS